MKVLAYLLIFIVSVIVIIVLTLSTNYNCPFGQFTPACIGYLLIHIVLTLIASVILMALIIGIRSLLGWRAKVPLFLQFLLVVIISSLMISKLETIYSNDNAKLEGKNSTPQEVKN